MTRTQPGRLPRPRAAPGDIPGVVVVCDHVLIRDALRSAFRTRGIPTIGLATPTSGSQLHDARRWVTSMQSGYGLLVSELAHPADLYEALGVLQAVPVAWLVLTSAPRGPVWGALLDAGAVDVLPASTSLDELSTGMRHIDSATWPRPAHDRADLVAAWRRVSEEQHLLSGRLAQLSTREIEVLRELHDGHSVRVIAARGGVAEGTVRTQVKSLLRKLGVNSQLQAVACYRRTMDWMAG